MNKKNIKNIEQLREIDEYLFSEIIEGKLAEIAYLSIKNSGFPVTARAFMLFNTKINFLKNSIFNTAEDEDTYSIRILYRSLLEHYLTFFYICSRFLEQRSDIVANEYYEFGDLDEKKKYVEALIKNNGIFSVVNKNVNKLEIIKEMIPELNKITLNDLQEKVNQFKYKNILDYFSNIFDLKKTSEKNELINKVLFSIIPEYSELSSFVHGGPQAEIILASINNEEERIKDVFKYARSSYNWYADTIFWTFTAANQYNKELGEQVKKVQNLYPC
jgi:hypothetical protein